MACWFSQMRRWVEYAGPTLKHGRHAICYMNGHGFVAATSMKLEGQRSTFGKLARIFFKQGAVVQQLFCISEIANAESRPTTRNEFPEPYKGIRSQATSAAGLVHFGCVVDEVYLGVCSFKDQVALPGCSSWP